jgi:hypothetical protein
LLVARPAGAAARLAAKIAAMMIGLATSGRIFSRDDALSAS